jgi:hypothetical protein
MQAALRTERRRVMDGHPPDGLSPDARGDPPGI